VGLNAARVVRGAERVMRKIRMWCVAAACVATGMVACGGDDVAVPAPSGDAGADGGGTHDASGGDAPAPADAGADQTSPPPPVDAGADAPRGDAAHDGAPADAPAADAEGGMAAPARLLLTSNTTGASELVAVNVASGSIDGRLAFPADFGGTYTASPDPWLLEQSVAIPDGGGLHGSYVARLDRAQPWVIDSQWSVEGQDRPDGAADYADPDAVVVSAAHKAYVLRYTRNEIAIIDPSQATDAGTPTGYIDFSRYVHANDSDGRVELTAGVYVPSRGLVYVLLGNIDLNNVAPDGFTILCADTAPTIMAIDVATDTIVSLTGGDANGALPLLGYNPGLGLPLVYDRTNDRLVVVDSGCNAVADGGAGPIQQRMIEDVSLFTGAASSLLDANANGFPSGFVFLDPHRAIVQFDFTGTETFLWDPAQPALGPLVPNAPDAFVWDGADNLLGVASATNADGGTDTDVVSVRIADGKRSVLTTNPFTLAGGFLGSVDLWPHP
jgi:hypothetical protein